MKAILLLLLATSLALGSVQDDRTVVLQVLKGVVEGIASEAKIDIDAVMVCVHDTETIIQELNEAYKLIKSNKFNNVKEGMRKI